MLCILMRKDSNQLALFLSGCSKLSNVLFLSMAVSPMSLNSVPLVCHRKADRNFEVYLYSSINHVVEQR